MKLTHFALALMAVLVGITGYLAWEGQQAAREMFAGHNCEVKDANIVGGNFKCRLVLTWTEIEDFWAFDDAWKTWVNS